MAFPYQVKTQSDIPAGMEAFYIERQDPRAGNQNAWFLDVTGAVPKSALDEFRTKNGTLATEIQTAQAQIATIAAFVKKDDDGETVLDAATVAGRIGELRTQNGILLKQKDAKGTGLTTADVESAVAATKQEMNQAHAAALKTATDESGTLQGQLDSLTISHELTEKAAAAGVKPEMFAAIHAMAKALFVVQNSDVNGRQVVALNSQGQPELASDGMTPVGIDTWLTQIEKDMPSAFEASSGLGSRHSGKSPASGIPAGVNPWKTETRNFTQQAEIENKNPALAVSLAAEAGVVLTTR